MFTKSIKKIVACLIFLTSLTTTLQAQDSGTVSAVMNKIKLNFELDSQGRPTYTLQFNGRPVIVPSLMGFTLNDGTALDKNFEIISTQKKMVDETWKPVWGEVSQIRNHYEQLTVQLKQKTEAGLRLNIVFRVFEDGLGFRYEFPRQRNLNYFVILNELTEFNMAGDDKTFWIPGDYDTNEYTYTTSKLSEIDNRQLVASSTDIAVRIAPDRFAVQTPLMLKSSDGLYINIHEAGLVNFAAMQLHVTGSTHKLTASLVPDAVGNKAYLHAPAHSPWRTVIVSDKAADILSSKIILNLNDPSVITNTSWIKPMKFVGVWWEMQTGRTTWSYATSMNDTLADGRLKPSGRHAATTANVKHYIDFAAANGIQGVLVEGWNTGWEDWFGYWKENPFDFVTPYPDFDIKAVTDYAKLKGVSMIMHNETSGAATSYDEQMDTAFRFMKKYGYVAVKTGYVGKIIPRGEHHDGQWMVEHYVRVAQKAADFQIMLDSHEAVRPTGLQRTYPNWMASEAGRGNEYNGFTNGGTPPEHETIMPFTRFMGGPMDFTPGIFKLQGFTPGTKRRVHTTLAKQLALYVVLYSPLQMAADIPENYEAHLDAFQFIKDVAVDWDDTKIIEAEPGDYVYTARKAKGTQNWFIGAITDENSRIATLPLNFLEKGRRYEAAIYEDAPDADCDKNPEAYKISKKIVTSETVLKIRLAPGGGCAVSLKLIN